SAGRREEGGDVTIVALSRSVLDALEAADLLAERGIQAEVIDPRTIRPLDADTIFASARKTGRLVVAHQACRTMGFGAEILARVAEEGIPVKARRVAGEDTPIPYSKPLEDRVLPNAGKIAEAAEELMS
ncbi:MAG: transketolase C-terminal domain-containing protein, partial [Spirochaetota bacterium]